MSITPVFRHAVCWVCIRLILDNGWRSAPILEETPLPEAANGGNRQAAAELLPLVSSVL